MKFTLILLAFLLLSCAIGCGGSKVCRPVWTFSAPEESLSRTITVADGVLYCLAGRGGCDDPHSGEAELMYALDASNGTTLWDLPLALEESIPRRVHRYAPEPLIEAAEGLLCYLRRDGQLRAFDHRTGKLRWEVSGVYMLLKISHGVHVLDQHSRYAVLDPATGAIRFSADFESAKEDAPINLPVVRDGNAYSITRAVGEDRLSALGLEAGGLLWDREFKSLRSFGISTPDETLLVMTSDLVTEINPETGLEHQRDNSHVLALDTKSGLELWRVGAVFWPQIDGDTVYYYEPTDTGYHTVGVDTKTGEKISDIPSIPWVFHGSPVVSEGVEYSLGYRAHYNALQKALLEGQRTPLQLESLDRWIIAKDARNGEVVWETTPRWGMGSIPLVNNGFVYQSICRAGQPPQLLAYRAAHISR